jgi:catechol 2,3-dioxygenase-like lactoylglutathione lyase family enzyme
MPEMDPKDERPPIWTGHLVLYGRDPQRSGAFYEKLGFRTVATLDSVAIVELRGGTHLVVRMDPDAQGGPAPFDFMVEDLDSTREAWQSMGIAVSEVSKDDKAIHRIFTVTDPDGNEIVVNDSHVVGPV